MELTKATLLKEIETKLSRHFGCTLEEAGKTELFKACATVMRDIMASRLMESEDKREKSGEKQVHYMSLEFLIGRSFLNNAYNLGLLDLFRETLGDVGIDIKDLMETEPDAGLGNGGLGRLAACYIDSMASLGLNASGYSIRYEHGLFKQRIVEGQQIELPDSWLDIGEVWLMPRMDEVREVRYGGRIDEQWHENRMVPELKDYTTVLAVPYDMLIPGHGTKNVCTLRLWSARSPVELDMTLFSRGEYLKAVEQHAMAETISKILYPDDKHIEGKSLRLKQQYFFVSATVQDIIDKHRKRWGTLENLAEKHVIQINDTHPAMVVPELMRILLDEEGYSWEKAWDIVTKTVAYTNHTIMAEALEQWPASLFEMNMPRIWAILREINQRYCAMLWRLYPGNFDKISRMSIIADNMVKMANLSVVSSFSVNGVSELHSNIIKDSVFHEYYEITPEKFTNVTNGIAHRRWLCEINPGLTKLLSSCIGDGFISDPSKLKDFERFAGDKSVLDKLARIKRDNKRELARFLKQQCSLSIDPSSMFDVQVKRLHEYKRQFLNVLAILERYIEIKNNPKGEFVPKTYIFGAKAFPGYYTAKQIIRLINSVAAYIDRDPAMKGLLKVAFVENYRVTAAERIIPAAEVSEQISVAGKEASGTGNMKFMINGAITLGTLDGANVEISEAVGDNNIFIFGLKAHEVEALRPCYNPSDIYQENERLREVFELINCGFGDGVNYSELITPLLVGESPDTYMLLADFDSYCEAHRKVDEAYKDKPRWNRMSLMNIANAGRFSSDRSIRDYANKIWHV
ncbi:MAG: glycogen/starch/alpha-glucan phosphorylase [Clostridiales bacterium]|nr:glycogen/starch/alpha-glucan phosphorylase [Clostridiales bacterium]